MTRGELDASKNSKFENFVGILAKQFLKALPVRTGRETFAKFYDVHSLPDDIKQRDSDYE